MRDRRGRKKYAYRGCGCGPLVLIFILLLVAAGSARKHEAPLVVAHRGGAASAPENTLPAYQKALAMGARGVECDVFLTLDGAVVLSHDSTIDRCSDGTGRIGEMTLAQLREYDYGVWFGAQFAGTRIPTLEEFLDTVQSAELILIEFKTAERDIVPKSVEAVRARGLLERTVFHSFDLDALAAVKEADPNAAAGYLYNPGSTHNRTINKDPAAFCARHNIDALHPQFAAATSGLVRRCARAGIDVRVWTVNNGVFLAGSCAQGVSAVITDVPEKAFKAAKYPAVLRGLCGVVSNAAGLLGLLFA